MSARRRCVLGSSRFSRKPRLTQGFSLLPKKPKVEHKQKCDNPGIAPNGVAGIRCAECADKSFSIFNFATPQLFQHDCDLNARGEFGSALSVPLLSRARSLAARCRSWASTAQ